MSEPARPQVEGRYLIWGIMAAVLIWGVFHAFGAARNYGNHNPLRGVMVIGCVLAFLGFWGLMLAVRRRRLSNHSDAEYDDR